MDFHILKAERQNGIKKYEYSSKYENLNTDNCMEFIIEFNNDDFIKIFCEKLEVDDKKVISIAN